MSLYVPDFTGDEDILTAALAYAEAGWYLGPLRAGSKHPGSVLGAHWQDQTTRDLEIIRMWFEDQDDLGIFLHVGRSGAWVADVDRPSDLPAVLRDAIAQTRPPKQQTRPDLDPNRGHYPFVQPEGRDLGNGAGGLGVVWGECRGRNGVIVVYPTPHPDGGEYRWTRCGVLPELSETVVALLPNASETADSVGPIELSEFLAGHTRADRPTLKEAVTLKYASHLSDGGARHEVKFLCWAMREARAGLYPARQAADALEDLYVRHRSTDRDGGRVATDIDTAHHEFRRLLAWAVGQALADDVDARRLDVLGRTNGASGTSGTPETVSGVQTELERVVVPTPLSEIKPRRVRWGWDGRLALGKLGLLAGPEGLGKSTVAVTIGASVTRGTLPGEHHGTPKAVGVVATEDDYAETIVPRFLAAGADLSRVHRIEVRTGDLVEELSMPDDMDGLERLAPELDMVLLILDPLISRLDKGLDSHKDGEVRRGLEPLVRVANRTGMAIWGIIHHNKSGSSDPLRLVMASKAFTAVARSVHTVIKDPDDESLSRRYFGTSKNNLGRSDLPSLAFTIESWIYDTEDGKGSTGKLVWGSESTESISDLINRSQQDPDKRTKEDEAVTWLESYMDEHGPRTRAVDGEAAGKAAGHSKSTLARARKRAGIESRKVADFDGGWLWVSTKIPKIPNAPPSLNPGILGSWEQPGNTVPNTSQDPIGNSPADSWDLRESDSVQPDDL